MNFTPEARFEQAIRENLVIAPMTTLGIGGPARYFAEVHSAEEVSVAIDWARKRELPLFVLGGGSNVVVSDEGFPGLMLRIDIKGVAHRKDEDRILLRVGAGEEWDPLVESCVESGWAGFECLSGIPGRVGATPIQNVGAYGQEISETLVSVEVVDRQQGRVCELNNSECEFGYRSSRFKSSDANRFIVTNVTYSLAVDGRPCVRYPELSKSLMESGIREPSLIEVRSAVIALRRRKAMVIDPDDGDSRSVGSFFVNPIVSQADLERVRSIVSSERVHALGNLESVAMSDRSESAPSIKKSESVPVAGRSESVPAFPQADGRFKLSAAWLIEHSGIKRGFVHGNVGVSGKHSLAIVNRGGGTAREVIELKNLVQESVCREFGIELIPEPVFVGIDS